MLEAINTLASVGTFLVIAATAVAAVLQLRHMRASNQIEAIQYAVTTFASPPIQRAIAFVLTELDAKLEEPGFRAEILKRSFDVEKHPERLVCNFQELMGTYVYHRLIPFDIYMDVAPATPHVLWDALEPYIAMRRRLSDHPQALYEYFEWLAAKSKAYATKYRAGVLAGRFDRLPVRDRYPDDPIAGNGGS